MREAVQAKCPNCTKILRIPADMLEMAVRCKHCGFAFQAKKKPAAKPVAQQPVPYGGKVPAPQAEPLPEYAPPPPVAVPAGHHTPHQPQARPPRPAPIIEALPAAAPTGYVPAYEQAGRKHKGKGAYKPTKATPWGMWAAVGTIGVCAFAALFFFVLKPDLFRSKPTTGEGDNKDVAQDNSGANDPGTFTQPGTGSKILPNGPAVTGPYPRRLLAITATNYLYANGITYGKANADKESDRRDFFRFMDKLATNWKIPPDQRYYVSDGPLANQKIDAKHPPLKNVIAGSIDNFLQSCRPQDRIVIVFAGHAIEKDGEAYLVPQEGEFEDVTTLIPVKGFYEKLTACPAQEKLIIYDVCRFDPGRGAERPIFGAMTEALEKVLHESPEGVSVYTSCAKDQYSYESDYYQVSIKGLRNLEIYGSTFLNVMFADSKAALSKSTTGRGIQSPNEPLPIQPLAEYLNEFVNEAMMDIEKKPQTPKLTYKFKGERVPYDPKDTLAAKINLADAPPSVDQKEIAAMFEEFRLPSIKATRKGVEEVRLGATFPFSAEDLKDYRPDGVTEEEIKKNPGKYPLRAATIEARDVMRDMRQKGSADELPEELRKSPNDADKKVFLANQRIPAKREQQLNAVRDRLEEVAKNREAEKSKRWQANYDYMLTQVKARQVYIAQYNLMLGKVRKDELPEPVALKEDDKSALTGWRLASVPDINGDPNGKTIAKEVKNDLESLIKDHPKTPWALQAKRERGLALGLQWQAVVFK